MRPGPSRAVQLLSDYLPISSEPIRARELLHRIIEGEEWFIGDLALEKAESWESGFLEYLRRELSGLNSLGKPTLFGFNSSSEEYVQGSAFILPDDSEEIRLAKTARSRLRVYQDHIATLTPRSFELMCKKILDLLGASQTKVTSYSADEGIDFYGSLKIGSHLAPTKIFGGFHDQMSVWLIGQAKHYQSIKVATPDIRELVGSIELAKSKAFGSVAEKYLDMNIRACDPVFYLFLTTGDISAAGWRLVENSGVIALNGEMVSAFLADHEIGIKDRLFDNDHFSNWLMDA